jgi:hypothetical protein
MYISYHSFMQREITYRGEHRVSRPVANLISAQNTIQWERKYAPAILLKLRAVRWNRMHVVQHREYRCGMKLVEEGVRAGEAAGNCKIIVHDLSDDIGWRGRR